MPLLSKSALLLCIAATSLAGCTEPKRIVTVLKPPPERLECASVGERPSIPPEYHIDWQNVSTVAQARLEHEKYVASIRTREGVIVGHILVVEGKLFVCGNNFQWIREWLAVI